MEIKKIILVFFTVLVTLATALLLNYGAKHHNISSLMGTFVIITVITINFLKFRVWGYVYQKYHLNESYPLTALFFPLIYAVAIINKEAELEVTKLIGISVILFGIGLMSKRGKSRNV